MANPFAADRVARLESPDGTAIRFELPGVGERLVAFVIDMAIAHLAWLGIHLLAVFTWDATVIAAGMFLAFMVRNFYFAAMEIAFSGRTLGKMALKLRVVSRDGGPLTAQAVLARNLTRDLEWFLPIVVLLHPTAIVPAGPGWGRLLGVLWLAVFLLMPFLNRQRLRVGDLIGGTLVVRHGRAKLAEDLTAAAVDGTGTAARHVFTVEQLGHYGVYELQTLESVLRMEPGEAHARVLERIAGKIRGRIGWRTEIRDPERFLRDFYRAQRAHLEQRMLFGQRKESKHSEPRPLSG